MSQHFKSGIKVFNEGKATPRLSTGNAGFDSLLGGGIKPGFFYLFYGDKKSGVDLLIHQILVNCLLPETRLGLRGKAVYANCGNYREEKTLLDSQLLGFLIKTSRLNTSRALGDIYVVCAFSEDQQEQSIVELEKLLERDREIRLVVVHNIARLFTSDQRRKGVFWGRIRRLQQVVIRFWQACVEREVALVASCRPTASSKLRVPPPEGGEYLRHKASVIVYFRRRSGKARYVTAYLRKHPSRAVANISFALSLGADAIGGINTPFRTQLEQEMKTLRRRFLEALTTKSRKKAFNSLIGVWSSEQGAMRYVKMPTILEVLLLTAAVDNRRLITYLYGRFEDANKKTSAVQAHLEELVK